MKAKQTLYRTAKYLGNYVSILKAFKNDREEWEYDIKPTHGFFAGTDTVFYSIPSEELTEFCL